MANADGNLGVASEMQGQMQGRSRIPHTARREGQFGCNKEDRGTKESFEDHSGFILRTMGPPLSSSRKFVNFVCLLDLGSRFDGLDCGKLWPLRLG